MRWNLYRSMNALRSFRQWLRRRPKTSDRPAGSTVRLEMVTMEERQSFNDIGMGLMAAGVGGALAYYLHQALAQPQLPAVVNGEVPSGGPAAEAAGSGAGPYREEAVSGRSAEPFVSYVGLVPSQDADDLDSARDSSGGRAEGRESPDGGGGGGGDGASSSGPGNSRGIFDDAGGGGSRENPLDRAPGEGGGGQDQLAPPPVAQAPASPAPIANLPPMPMSNLPFAGTGGSIEAQGGTPAMPAPPTPGLPGSAGQNALSFTPNHGQADPQYQFVGHAQGFDVGLSSDGITYTMGTPGATGNRIASIGDQVHMTFVGANAAPQLVGVDPVTRGQESGVSGQGSGAALAGLPTVNQGSVPTPGVPDIKNLGTSLIAGSGVTPGAGAVPTAPGSPGSFGYKQVDYQGVYNGINLDFYRNNAGNLEYDWVVAAGADPSQIKVQFTGADRLSADAQGNLQISTVNPDRGGHP